MKCMNRIEYDCCYLNKYNIEEFIELFKNFNNVYSYSIYDEFLHITIKNPEEEDFDEILDNYDFSYNRWYVFKNGNIFDYDPEYFMKHYTLILVD